MRKLAKVFLTLLFLVMIVSAYGCMSNVSEENDSQNKDEEIGTSKDDQTEETVTKVITKNDKLEVTYPVPYAEITNPVTVTGKSNFFETATSIRITDVDGQVLANTSTLAEGWMDKLYPFSKEITYDIPSDKNGFVEVFENSAKDGSEINKITIPVTFKINE